MNTIQTNAEMQVKPIGTEIDKTVADSAVALVTSAQVPAQCRYACITNGAQPIMLTFDGVDPTTATGAYKTAALVLWVSREAILAAKAIRSGGTSSVVHISFWA
jgi:hypothetical protein